MLTLWNRDRVSGPFISGPAVDSYGLRARFFNWPPHRPSRLSFELEEVVAVRPTARVSRAGTAHTVRKEVCG